MLLFRDRENKSSLETSLSFITAQSCEDFLMMIQFHAKVKPGCLLHHPEGG
jgi:hypothetical protein